METDDLTTRLRGAAEGIMPPPGFTDAVTRGGRRRRHRRHLVAGLVSVTVLAMAVGTVTLADSGDTLPPGAIIDENGDVVIDPPPVLQNGELWLSGPTRGDLADDSEVLDGVRDAWRAYLPGSPNGLADSVRGEPNVYWAGTTPLGPAAVVAQAQGRGAALGLVAFEDGTPRVLTDARALVTLVGVGLQFGPGDDTLLVPDPGVPLVVSTGAVRAGDGTVSRLWEPLPMTDGVAVLSLPADSDPSAIRVRGAGAGGGPTGEHVMLLPASRASLGWDHQSKYRAENRLDWPLDVFTLPGGRRPPESTEPFLVGAGFVDPYLTMAAGGLWTVATAMPDGRPVWVTEYQEDSNPSRLITIIGADPGTAVVLDGGPVDRESELPVRVRLPDGAGRVVAERGATLRYRVAQDAAWVDAGRDAALLPSTAVEVEVTAQGGAPVIVTL